MTEYNLFCWAEEYNDDDSFQQKRYRVWNKEVGEKRYYEIREMVNILFSDIKLKLNENSWKDEWKKVPNSVWIELSKIPEFDKEITEKITNIKFQTGCFIEVEQKELIEIDGKKWSKSTIKEALKHHAND